MKLHWSHRTFKQNKHKSISVPAALGKQDYINESGGQTKQSHSEFSPNVDLDPNIAHVVVTPFIRLVCAYVLSLCSEDLCCSCEQEN